MENDIEHIKAELEAARYDLHRTVTEVNERVEAVKGRLQPTHLLHDHVLLSGMIAGALGFACGSHDDVPVSLLLVSGLIGAIATGTLGYDS